MKFRLTRPNRKLTAPEIFKLFARDSLLTAAIYLVLVVVTLLLGYGASFVQDAARKKALEGLELTIFFAETFVAMLIIFSVTVLATKDLFLNLRDAFFEDDDAVPGGRLETHPTVTDHARSSSAQGDTNARIQIVVDFFLSASRIGWAAPETPAG